MQCCYSNGVMGAHSPDCCLQELKDNGMTLRDELVFRASLCYQLAAHYRDTLATMLEEKNPDICTKVHCTEKPFSNGQMKAQKSCTVDTAAREPDLSKTIPCLGTVARFVFNRSVCHMFNLDWTNKLYYSPVALPNLCRRQPWLTNMDQSTLMPAAISRPGLSQPQHIIAAGVIINTVLETRNRPFDSCVTLAVDVGTERRPFCCLLYTSPSPRDP